MFSGIIDPSVLAESLQILGSVSVHQVTSDLRATLVQLRLKGARNIIIDTGVSELEKVIQATLDTGMMTKSYNYIFTMLVCYMLLQVTACTPLQDTFVINHADIRTNYVLKFSCILYCRTWKQETGHVWPTPKPLF
jgi:hypothetical protein